MASEGHADAVPSPSRLRISARLRRLVQGTDLHDRLAHGAIGALGVTIASMGVGFLAQLVLARVLGATNYGVYAYVFAWVNVLVLLSELGLPTALVRFVAAYRARNEWGLLRGAIAYGLTAVAAIGATVSLSAAAVVWLLGARLDPAMVAAFYVGLATVPLAALLSVASGVVRALGWIITALAAVRLVPAMTNLLGVGALGLFFTSYLSAATAIGVGLGGALVGLCLIGWALHVAYPAAARGARRMARPREWLGTALPLLLLAGSQTIMGQIDVLMLGWLRDTTDAGIYVIVARVAALTTLPLTAVNFAFAPTISALHARHERDGLQRTVTMTAWWTTLGALAVGVPLFVAAGFWLGWFGEAFVNGATGLRILLFAQLIHGLTGAVGQLMVMTGKERLALAVAASTTLLNVPLNALLIPPFGVAGAAAASAFCLALWNAAAVVVVWRWLGIVPGVFASFSSLRRRTP